MVDTLRVSQAYFFPKKMPTLSVFVSITGLQENAKSICSFEISSTEAEEMRKARYFISPPPTVKNLFKCLFYELQPRLKNTVCVGHFPYECSGRVCGSASILWLSSDYESEYLLAHDVEVPFCKHCKTKVANRAHNYTEEYKHALCSPLHDMS